MTNSKWLEEMLPKKKEEDFTIGRKDLIYNQCREEILNSLKGKIVPVSALLTEEEIAIIVDREIHKWEASPNGFVAPITMITQALTKAQQEKINKC